MSELLLKRWLAEKGTKAYSIRLATTEAKTVIEMDLTEDEKILLERVAEKTKWASRYGGMPVLEIYSL